MNTATPKKSQSAITSFEEAKASLVQKFITRINKIPKSMVLDAAKLKGDKALAVIIQKPEKANENSLSIKSTKSRNQIALAKMKAKAFEAIKSSYDLLDANDACEILGISKQALSKKTKAGQVISYTNNRRKYYPDFQFENNKVISAIGKLTKTLGINVDDEPLVNVLIGFLANPMDFSNPGENHNTKRRYELINNAAAFEIIVRDFKNRLEMGK